MFEENEVSIKSKGGTEMVKRGVIIMGFELICGIEYARG